MSDVQQIRATIDRVVAASAAHPSRRGAEHCAIRALQIVREIEHADRWQEHATITCPEYRAFRAFLIGRASELSADAARLVGVAQEVRS